MIFSVYRYCSRLCRLSHKRHGDGVDTSPPHNDVMSSLASRGVSLNSPPRHRHHWPGRRNPVKSDSARSADAEEICKLLEQAVLKYFPRPIENVDTDLFPNGDDDAVGDLQSPSPPGATTNALKRGLSFLRF